MLPDELAGWLGLLMMSAGAAAVVAVLLTGRLGSSALARAPKRRCGLTGVDLLAGLCLFLLGNALARAVLEALGLQGESLSAQQHAIRVLLAQAIGHGVAVAFLILRAAKVRRGLYAVGLVPRSTARDVAAAVPGLLVGLSTAMGLNVAVSLVSQAFGLETPEIGHELLKVMHDSGSVGATVALICSAVVVAPVMEEIVFRGLVQSSLLDLFGRARRWPVILCASAVFTAVHYDAANWQTLPGLFVLGVVLGWLYERHGSLLPSVLVHVGFNVCNIVLMFTVGS